MKAMCVVLLALAAVAFADEAKEAKEFKFATPYAYGAHPYGYYGAGFPYAASYGYAPAAYPFAFKYAPAAYSAYAAPYPYGYAAPAAASYSLKLDDSKEPSAYLPGAYAGFYGYSGFPFVAKKD